ncbi:hypothetical protein ABZP36_022780 [Zizania latifolia]
MTHSKLAEKATAGDGPHVRRRHRVDHAGGGGNEEKEEQRVVVHGGGGAIDREEGDLQRSRDERTENPFSIRLCSWDGEALICREGNRVLIAASNYGKEEASACSSAHSKPEAF